jgi:hypothetical protein
MRMPSTIAAAVQTARPVAIHPTVLIAPSLAGLSVKTGYGGASVTKQTKQQVNR